MCGIFFACSSARHIEPDSTTRDALQARGPDSLRYRYVKTEVTQQRHTCASDANDGWYLTFASSVLSLRGDCICVQPLVDPSTGSVLCWNGEAWKVDDVPVSGNDTQQIFQLLLDVSSSATAHKASPEVRRTYILKLLTRIAGPSAFVYYDAVSSVVFYGRDRLGRRSLVISDSNSSSKEVVISSVSFDRNGVAETTTDGIDFLDLNGPALRPQKLLWSTNNVSINTTVPEDQMNIPSIPSGDAIGDLKQQLLKAIQIRVIDVPTYTTNNDQSSENPSKIAVLFSGGLDCTLLARLAHDILPSDQPIDLVNVAFENPRTVRAAMQGAKGNDQVSSVISPYEACPDRVTARSSFAELATTCSTRIWRFVTVDVPYTDTVAHRSNVISLMSPHNTEMDLSITLALYFASRGQGQAVTSANHDFTPTPYTTTARVLLSGLGADELFAGYARHAAAFNRNSYTDLIAELELDISRIGSRNLGRDDRVLSHWGREIRYPYLDEGFVNFALSLPVWEKTGFRLGKTVPKHFERPSSSGTQQQQIPALEREEDLDPAKMVLRMMAWRSGMRRVAAEKKRAIQFGARTAKMEGGRIKGTDLLVL